MQHSTLTLIILSLSIALFIYGKPRSDMVALCSLLALVLTGILTPVESLQGFSNPITIMMVGLFVVGAGILRTGLAKKIGSRIILMAGNSETKIFFLIMIFTSCVGAFVSNTGTVAMMMPIAISVATSAGINPKRYLMPLAFSSSMGLFTLISTSPNLVINEFITKNGYKPLAFFSFAPIGAICVLVGIITLFFLSRLLTKETDSNDAGKHSRTLLELAEIYSLRNRSYILTPAPDSPALGMTLAQLQIATTYQVNVNKISRKTGTRLSTRRYEILAGPNTVIMPDDILYCQGSDENIAKFAEDTHMNIVKKRTKEAFARFDDFGIAEIYILPESQLVKRTIAEVRFRERYNVTVLGIRRNGKYIDDNTTTTVLQQGDALLVQGKWGNLAELDNEQADLVVVGQPLKDAATATLDSKANIAALIMLAMITSMATGLLQPVTAVLCAAVMMVFTGCLRNTEEAYSSISWQSVLLIAGMMPMATAFDKTGLTASLAGGLVQHLGDMGPYALMAGVYFLTSLLTMFISNTATAILFAPIAMQVAQSAHLSPYPFMFAVAVGATMCFASPFSTPPNAIVMTAGRYNFMDYIRVGLPLQLLMAAVMIVMLPVLFPF